MLDRAPSASLSTPWLLRPRPKSSPALRLLCFAHAGGGASSYRLWADSLPPDIELCAVQLPGREGRWKEPRFRDLPTLVPELLAGIAPWLDRPYAIFGHSLGALIGYETAVALRDQGKRVPVHLFVSSHRGPHRPNPHPATAHLTDGAFIDEIGRRYGGVPQAVLDSPELLALMLPCLRDDITIFESYQYRPRSPLAMPITVMGGRGDQFVTAQELADWESHTTGRFSRLDFAGDHFYLQDARNLVIAHIANALSQSVAASAGGRA